MEFDPQMLSCLRHARSIVVLTGAGVSAESGVPTFRDALTGLWSKFKPEDLATPDAFARDPEMVARWYDQRRLHLKQCAPNPGHLALARWQALARARGAKWTLITQNVDRLHQRAGSTDVIELHGSIWVWRCTRCRHESEETGDAFETYPPRCVCGVARRPDVVWFGEMLPVGALDLATIAAGACDVFLSLGTSALVHPAAGLVDVALRNDARLIEINPDSTPQSDLMNWILRAPAGEVLPPLVEALADAP